MVYKKNAEIGKNPKKTIKIVTLILSYLILYGFGVLVFFLMQKPSISIETLKFRSRNGKIEWFDGAKWNLEKELQEMINEDIVNKSNHSLIDFETAFAEENKGIVSEKRSALGKKNNICSNGDVPVVKQTVTSSPSSGGARQSTGVQQSTGGYSEPSTPQPQPPATSIGDGEDISW